MHYNVVLRLYIVLGKKLSVYSKDNDPNILRNLEVCSTQLTHVSSTAAIFQLKKPLNRDVYTEKMVAIGHLNLAVISLGITLCVFC